MTKLWNDRLWKYTNVSIYQSGDFNNIFNKKLSESNNDQWYEFY